MTWRLALKASELGRRPLALTLRGTAVVLMRDRRRQPWGLIDRCPGSGQPLSRGKLVADRLVCACHGWAFDRTGMARNARGAQLPVIPAPSVSVCELRPYLWISLERRDRSLPDPLVGRPFAWTTARETMAGTCDDLHLRLLAHWLGDGEFQPTPLVNLFNGDVLLRMRSGREDLLVRPGAIARVSRVWPVAQRATVVHFTETAPGLTRVDRLEATLGKQAWLLGWPGWARIRERDFVADAAALARASELLARE